jgi:hypothetical protein
MLLGPWPLSHVGGTTVGSSGHIQNEQLLFMASYVESKAELNCTRVCVRARGLQHEQPCSHEIRCLILTDLSRYWATAYFSLCRCIRFLSLSAFPHLPCVSYSSVLLPFFLYLPLILVSRFCNDNVDFAAFKYDLETQWPQSANELYRPSDRRLSAKLVPNLCGKRLSRG